jgi:uncharacterized protein YhfF
MSFPRVDGLRALELGSPGSDLQRTLNALVLAGDKRATAGLLSEYADEGEELEHVGEEQVLVDADGRAIALVRYTRVEVVPFAAVTWEFARAEGEGFNDIDDWQRAHRRYWQRESGIDVTDDEPVVCLWFDVLEAPPAAERADSIVVLETARLRLRRFTPADVDLIVELDADPEVMHFITGGLPTSRSEIADVVLPYWLGFYEVSPVIGFWAAEMRTTGEFVGWFHLRPREDGPPDELELGYRLRRSAWGAGLATEGSLALVDLAFERADATRVVAETMAVHGASRRVMEKVGMRLVRTFHADWPYPIPGDELGDVEYAIERAEWEIKSADANAESTH